MDVCADPLSALRTRTSVKWTMFDSDVLPLPIAESDFPLPEPITRTLLSAIHRSDTGYASEPTELAIAFAGFAHRRWGWMLDRTQVRATTDVGVAIVEVLRASIAPGDGVIITSPVYFPFFGLIPEAGGTVVDVPLQGNIDVGWRLDLPGIEAALAAGARAVLLCNPHNPVGVVHSADDLQQVALLARSFGAVVISDEIHGPLTYEGTSFTPFLSISEQAREVGVCVTAASKAWNIAGLKCALIVSGTDIFERMPEKVFERASILGQHASIAAFSECDEWVDASLRTLDRNRRLLHDLLAQHLPDVGYRMPESTYLAWLDLRCLGWGDDPAAVALERGRVALNSGHIFGGDSAGFARLNFACSPEVLTEAVERIAAIVSHPDHP